jgi:hypothetical protein
MRDKDETVLGFYRNYQENDYPFVKKSPEWLLAYWLITKCKYALE